MPPARRRILCVEDHEDTCYMLSSLLGMENYDAQFVNNIDETLRVIETEDYDLFILDKQLPDGSGIELCEELRERFPRTPIIIYAATATEGDSRESFLAGATDYVAKPGVDELVEAVARQLSRDKDFR
jgi:two-component system, OmpR family, phosphate regulon response regulator PhoB